MPARPYCAAVVADDVRGERPLRVASRVDVAVGHRLGEHVAVAVRIDAAVLAELLGEPSGVRGVGGERVGACTTWMR